MARPRSPRVIGRIFKTVLLALVFGVTILALWRILSAGDPKAVKMVCANEELVLAYRAADGELNGFSQDQATITRAENNYGYFSVTRWVYFPEANQLQLVFRYNKSTLKHLAEDKNLQDIPSKTGTYFDVSVVKTTDLTRQDKTDNLDASTLLTERFAPVGDPVREETSLYTYFRYTFRDVVLKDDTDGLFADIYYLGDLTQDGTTGQTVYPADPYGALCLWDSQDENIPYRLTSADRKVLEAWGNS